MKKNLEEIEVCPSCLKKQWKIFRDVERDGIKQKFIICSYCLLVKQSPSLTDKKLYEYYKSSYNKKNYNSEISSIFETMKTPAYARIKYLEKHKIYFKPNEKVLEIGPGSGSMLSILKEKGLNVEGIEPDSDASNWIKNKLNITVLNIFFDELENNKSKEWIENPFDWIIVTHLLEHIRNPGKFLSEISKFIKPEGKILIEIPNANNPYSDGDEWGHLFDPGHFFYYTTSNLRKLLLNNSYKINLIGDDTLKPYRNIICVASKNNISQKFNMKNQGSLGIIKIRLIWDFFKLKHILIQLLIKNPGRFMKYKIFKIPK